MKNKKLYDKTVGILVDAYLNNTLLSQNCTCCAVGNIIAANNSYKILKVADEMLWYDEKNGNYLKPEWGNVFGTLKKKLFGFVIGTKPQQIYIRRYNGLVKEEILSSGYELHELTRIEYAFEVGYKGKDKMFNALMSVIECLDEIHENKDLTLTENTKKLFKKEVCTI